MSNNCHGGINAPVAGLQAQVPVVIRRGATQILVEANVPFPQEFPATEIVRVMKRVRDLHVFVCANKAVINGVLNTNVIYKSVQGNYNYRHIGNEPEATFGEVRQIGFNTPFSGFVEVPGARPGDEFIVNFAGVEDECELDTLEDPINTDCPVKQFRRIRISTIVRVDISIIRHAMVPVGTLGENLTPVMGTETGNNNYGTGNNVAGTGNLNNNSCGCD